ncbi:MAG: hypothetical protein RPU64_04340, partial [Candidatus Sedimenticola sp. (ex Thyasira tokunagai)]
MGAGVIPFAVNDGEVYFLFQTTFSGRKVGHLIDFRCQPWRAKRRLVIPGSREAALLTRRARSAPEGKQSRHPNTASSHWE